MKLNGWQRLWVVFAGLWVVALGTTWVDELVGVNKKIFDARYRLATDISVWEKHGCILDFSPSNYGMKWSGIEFPKEKAKRAKKVGLIIVCDSSNSSITINPIFVVRHYGDTPKGYIQDALSRFSKEKDASKVEQFEQIYTNVIYDINSVLDRRKEAIGLGLAFALLPPLAVYLFGLSFVWIRKGFKGEQS